MQKLKSWIDIPDESDFSVYNLPYGIFSADGKKQPGAGIAIGNLVLDLAKASKTGIFKGLDFDPAVFEKNTLNDYIGLGKTVTNKVRNRVQQALCDENSPLKGADSVFKKQREITLHLPVKVGDYTDFYSSIEHATNVGKMFRDPENALLPNWKHLPVGYHGRASSIILSGQNFQRPKGQTRPGDGPPVFGSTQRLDFELEMAFVIGKGTALGETISTGEAEDHIFGLVLFNDWSARDIQKWEYVPLGPFLGKSFASSISPWIVPLEALEPFRTEGPVQDPPVLPYLQFYGAKNYDIDLEVAIRTENSESPVTVCRSNFRYMYWNMAQQLAHHTINGCNVRPGDMMASGTISGQEPDSFGSMLELSWAGSHAVKLDSGEERKFIEDNDTVIMKGRAQKEDIRVGFGEVSTKVLPATE